MNYTNDDISSMFEDTLQLSPLQPSQNTEGGTGESYTACPSQCASQGGEDYWC